MNYTKQLSAREIASAQKKEHIFNVSLELFKKYGYHNVTIKTISKESGISEGSIYNFFKEKAGILSMLTEQILKKHYELIEPTEENLKDPAKTIHQYMMAQFDAYESCGKDLDDVYLSNIAKFTKKPYYVNSNFIDSVIFSEPDLINFIKIAIEKGKMTCSIDSVEFAFMITSLASGILHSWISYGENTSLHDTANQVMYNVIHAIIK